MTTEIGYHAVEVAIYVVAFGSVCTLGSLQMASGRASIAGASLFLIERYCRAICDDFHVSALQKLLRNNVSAQKMVLLDRFGWCGPILLLLKMLL